VLRLVFLVRLARAASRGEGVAQEAAHGFGVAGAACACDSNSNSNGKRNVPDLPASTAIRSSGNCASRSVCSITLPKSRML
jgi:hypothetical protein